MKKLKLQVGMTLIELLTAMVVIAIIAGLAVPSFNAFTQNNKLVSSTTGFVSAIGLARSEAVTRNTPIFLCILAPDGINCHSGGENWALGWIVFQNLDGDINAISDGEAIRYFPTLPGNQSLTRPSESGRIEVLPNGLIRDGEFEMELCLPGAGDARRIQISAMGRASVEVIPSC